MQTFLISTESFEKTAEQLDDRRLNKQILEAWQLLLNILNLDPEGNVRFAKGWTNHPAKKMWVGSELELYNYIQVMCVEWEKRGHSNVVKQKSGLTLEHAKSRNISLGEGKPVWMVDADLYGQICSTHRQALLFKEYEFYSQFGWVEDAGVRPESYDYVWPV